MRAHLPPQLHAARPFSIGVPPRQCFAARRGVPHVPAVSTLFITYIGA